jgi:Fe2+ transport system protein FeoA
MSEGVASETLAQFQVGERGRDPIEIKLRGYHLSLRKHEAAGIRAERL